MSMSAITSARRLVGSLLPPATKQRVATFMQDFAIAAKFGAPNLAKPAIRVSPRARAMLNELRANGIVRIESDALRAVADRLDRVYLERLTKSPTGSLDGNQFDDHRLFALDANADTHRAFGAQIAVWVSFKDEALAPLLRDPDIAGMIYNYYRRQPYYRNQPRLQYFDVRSEHKIELGNDYHVDRYHQVSAMLLISDQTANDTHMEYLVGSHRRPLLRTRVEMPYDECRRWAEAAPELSPLATISIRSLRRPTTGPSCGMIRK